VKETEFTGVRLEVDTPLSIDELQERLRRLMGRVDIAELRALAQESDSEVAFTREVETRFVGEGGFMLFTEFDHSWISRFGIRRRVLRWLLGNPLIAITMLRHDVTAGLFVPVEILLTDRESGSGSTITYLRPSSLIAATNPSLLGAASALDNKLAAFITRAVNS
jgi:uncharacterized protein (DUF302 family)